MCRIEAILSESRRFQVLLVTLRIVVALDCAIQRDATVTYALPSFRALF